MGTLISVIGTDGGQPMTQLYGHDPLLSYLSGVEKEAPFSVREFSIVERGAGNVRVSLFALQPGESTGIDSHAVHEIWLVISGHARLDYDGKQYQLQPRSVYYFAPFKHHSAFNDGEDELLSYSVWWP